MASRFVALLACLTGAHAFHLLPALGLPRPRTGSHCAPARTALLRSPVMSASRSRASASGLFCLHVCLRVKPGRRDEFLECIQANQRGTLTTEPLAVSYLFGEDENTPNTFHFFEAYRGREGFDAHTKAPHFAEWERFVATDPLTAEPQVCAVLSRMCCVRPLTRLSNLSTTLPPTHNPAGTGGVLQGGTSWKRCRPSA
jgi:autoinducer 2-degrading protein